MAGDYLNSLSIDGNIHQSNTVELMKWPANSAASPAWPDSSSIGLFNGILQSPDSPQKILAFEEPRSTLSKLENHFLFPDSGKLALGDTAVTNINFNEPVLDNISLTKSVNNISAVAQLDPGEEGVLSGDIVIGKEMNREDYALIGPSAFGVQAPYAELQEISGIETTNPPRAKYLLPSAPNYDSYPEEENDDVIVTIVGPDENGSIEVAGTEKALEKLDTYLEWIRDEHPGVVSEIQKEIEMEDF